MAFTFIRQVKQPPIKRGTINGEHYIGKYGLIQVPNELIGFRVKITIEKIIKKR